MGKGTFGAIMLNNWYWFRAGIGRLKAYEQLAACKLAEVTNETVAGFAAHEQTRLQKRGKGEDEDRRGPAVSSINSTIRVLRRILRLATEWGVIESVPKLSLLSGERHRERVITREEMRSVSHSARFAGRCGGGPRRYGTATGRVLSAPMAGTSHGRTDETALCW